MKKEQTLLARIVQQYYPKKGTGAMIIIDPRGKNTEQLLVERGVTNDSDIELMKNDFCFVKLVLNGQYYKIDKVVPVDNTLLMLELIS